MPPQPCAARALQTDSVALAAGFRDHCGTEHAIEDWLGSKANGADGRTMIKGIYETHLDVSDLDRSMAFYGGTLGLELGLRTELDAARADSHSRGCSQLAIYWVGGWGNAALGLWERPEMELRVQHFAFELELDRMGEAVARLQAEGIEVRDFFMRTTGVPTVFGWVPTASVYFEDPDGHQLEYLARVPGPPAPDVGIVTWDEWERRT